MTNVNTADGQEIAIQNELNTLYWLYRFGGLLTRQVAALVWPGASQGVRMAQRTLRRLAVQKQVLRRELRTGGVIHVLSEAGARRLLEYDIPASARGTRDLRWDKPFHRVLANDYAIESNLQTHAVWTEFEIQRGKAPIRKLLGCIPDVLVCKDPENHSDLDWIEIENSAKSQSRLGQLLTLGEKLLSHTDGYRIDQYYITGLIFVTPNQPSFRAVVRAAKQQVHQDRLSFSTLSRISICTAQLSNNLAWNGLGERCSLLTYLGSDNVQPEETEP